MCSNAVSYSSWEDSLLGDEECRSPFGTYELVIPVDDQLSGDDPGITNKNCRELDVCNYFLFASCFFLWELIFFVELVACKAQVFKMLQIFKKDVQKF